MMKPFHRSFALATAVCLAAVAAASTAYHSAVTVVHAVCSWAWERIEPVLAKFTSEPSAFRPRVAFVAAKAFVLRLAKRERPRISPTWRMCPSA